MPLVNNISLNIYSIIFLIILYIHSARKDDKSSFSHKLYMVILTTTAFLLVVDIFSRFDGKPDTFYYELNHIGNFLIFLMSPILPSIWYLYAHFQVFNDEVKTKRLIPTQVAIVLVNGIIVVLTQYFGWYYFIDDNNIYHRGPLFLLAAFFSVALIFMAFGMIVINRKKIEKRHFFSLVFFAVPPFISIIFQVVFYGISLMLNSVVLSLLIVFLNIQNQDINTDHLTGIYNRKKLEYFMKKKIDMCTEKRTFSAIMLDINNFKLINDTYGHDAGDKALEASAKLLKGCIRTDDFIARFGGDEFCIILNISNTDELEQAILRIKRTVENYNESSKCLYKLCFSMGYAVYDYESHMKVEDFQKHIDSLMYKDKLDNRARQSKDNVILP